MKLSVKKIKPKYYIYTAIFLFNVFWWSLANKTMATAPILLVIPPVVTNSDTKSSFSELVNNQYFKPFSVEIPTLNVNSRVEIVGIHDDGTMETPVNFANVGWLETSSRVGQSGNLIISGHYDYPGGAPAVFYNLNSLHEGDYVYINYSISAEKTVTKQYIITNKYLANPNNTEHIEEAYRDTKIPTITLITCNGIWDPVKGEYSHRVVVQGELVQEPSTPKHTSNFLKNQFAR